MPKTTVKPPAPAVVQPVPAAPALDPATVLVDVAGSKLTAGEADKQIMAMMGAQAAQLGADRMASLMGRFRQQAVERFVIRTVLSSEAEKRQIQVSDGDIAQAMETIKGRLPEGVTLDEALKRENLTTEGLRSNLVSELRIKKLVESEVPTNNAPTDEDVAKFYESQKEQFKTPESVEARHILVKMESTDDEKVKAEKKAKADGLRKQLVDGADFAKLAKENSDCPSKDRGGDLGSFQRGQMVKAFEDAAFSQETNAIGPVVETMFGYHIIQVKERKAAGASSLADVKDRLVEHLKQRKQMELFDAFLAKIKENVKIAYADGFAPAPKNPAVAE
jgi:peptidyl-prolyl cis-trans isomerase C